MESIVIAYDGSVRNSNRHLVQLSYGEDGMDGAFMEFQQLPSIKPSDSAFKRRFYFDCSDQRWGGREREKGEKGGRGKRTVGSGFVCASLFLPVLFHRMLTRCFKEWSQLREDRKDLRSIFPTGNSKVRVIT